MQTSLATLDLNSPCVLLMLPKNHRLGNMQLLYLFNAQRRENKPSQVTGVM